ncbi:MAG: alpha amylase C-terminal domain-containing protein [Desulfobacteraceae bacterium]|nr:alpha amylase C-terminal domain-containing protein [Desulfobacteraceae bacterium]
MNKQDHQRLERFLSSDPYLESHKEVVARRIELISKTARQLISKSRSLGDFASGHEYYGLHFRDAEWVLREWAPNATAVYLVGEFSGWRIEERWALKRLDNNGTWEIRLSAKQIKHGDLYRLHVQWPDGSGDRIPAWARRVVQDPATLIFNAQVWRPDTPYQWRVEKFKAPKGAPLIYEVHIGMAQEEGRVGTYAEFTANVLPRVIVSGYNTLQIMAIPEHPYYGSFGYHVSNFFAASSRFGPPEDFKALVDAAHAAGLRVLIDLVHSHAVNNEVEGISRFDGSEYQFFHVGGRGRHHAWDSRLFDYAKPQVLHFLLSNCRYWLDEFRVDGFRFDGITSMLYLDHGLEKAFTSYDDYFSGNVDEDALCYLALANQLIHAVRPDALTIAEDVSGMPGLARPWREGGIGFDYRFAMGVPDYWIKLTKDTRDEDWHMGGLWFELNNRRHDEKTISYTESHDQALVGDKTLIFRMIDAEMYHHMNIDDPNLRVDRGMALHKMIRLITLATAGNGYLNFMGNEFGHPEWIDFPRQGNNWSYHYARRQWSLVDNARLRYQQLNRFDQAMIALARKHEVLSAQPHHIWEHNDDKILIFERAGLVWAFNFHPTQSFADYQFSAAPGKYAILLDSDAPEFGGHNRIDRDLAHLTLPTAEPHHPSHRLSLYLPSRAALVLGPSRG